MCIKKLSYGLATVFAFTHFFSLQSMENFSQDINLFSPTILENDYNENIFSEIPTFIDFVYNQNEFNTPNQQPLLQKKSSNNEEHNRKRRENKVLCTACGHKLRKEYLKKHQETFCHSSDKRRTFTCILCDSIFITQKQLDIHLLDNCKATSRKQYFCTLTNILTDQQCNHIANSASALYKHKKNFCAFRPNKPLCSFRLLGCLESFQSETLRKKHEKTCEYKLK